MKFLLVMFGWFSIITSALFILVPYFRRRHDLINSWTLFQLGCANFLGITAVQTGNSMMHLYGNPDASDYLKFVLGGALFYLISGLTYFLFNWPQRVAQRVLTKWGPRAPRSMMLMLPICGILTLGLIFVPEVQFIGQWMVFFGRYAALMSLSFCLVAWAQRPFNVWMAVISGLAFIVAAVISNMELGRRDFLSVMITVPLCWYWLRGRYYNPAHVLLKLGVVAVIGSMVLTGVSIIRFAKKNPDASMLQAAWEKVKAIPHALSSPGDSESLFGGDAVDASLAAIRLYDRTQPTQPFFTLWYVLVHPVPRAWWPDKPEGLGYTLPIDIGWSSQHGAVNLGPGIIGHFFHEGGFFFVVFYAVFFASIMRFYDSLLMRDPSNPFLLGILGSISGQITAFARGDIGLFSVLILSAFLTGLLLSAISRFLFGTERIAPMESVLPGEYTHTDVEQSYGEAPAGGDPLGFA